ncbi:MAG: hypothetical protein Q8P51_14415 [Ignavibacteria bacterium]|nr:hypothetical protein [Ignavibacteria bacterium]
MKKLDLNLNETRRTVINWPNELKEIIDRYHGWQTISHGVQKDAVQNSWDARLDRAGAKGWSVEFELIENKETRLFAFTDQGTTGLTGRVLSPQELQLDLPIEERWGRFENVAFTKEPSERALGARGRGKFIFVGASQHEASTNDGSKIQNLIVYDSLRPDDTYRFGLRTIITTDSPVLSCDGDEGRKKLSYYTKDLVKPLTNVGTRVIVVEPIDELVESVKNGSFLRSIEETWWEIIKEYDAEIHVKTARGRQRATFLDELAFPEKDTRRYKIWKRQNVKLPGAPVFHIKDLTIVYDAQAEYAEDLRGISMQRGGMKICPVMAKYVDKSVANAITGYIRFDSALEDKLREDEGPEHYSFDFKKDIPRFVRQFIEDEYEKFFRDKLGLNSGAKPRTYEKSHSAEMKALYQINKLASQLGILGKGILPTKSGGTPAIDRPIKLQFGKIGYPNDVLRVDYGQVIKNIRLSVTNDTGMKQGLGVRFSILYDEQDEIANYIDNKEFEVGPHNSEILFDIPKLTISQTEYKIKGKYTFFARLVSLNPNSKGQIVHQLQRHFWVEENPPQKGIFEDIDKFEFPSEKETAMGFSTRTETGGYIFSYNTAHPAKRAVESDEDEFMKYLIELMSLELAWIDLRGKTSKIFTQTEREEPAQLVRRLTQFLGEVRFKINRKT